MTYGEKQYVDHINLKSSNWSVLVGGVHTARLKFFTQFCSIGMKGFFLPLNKMVGWNGNEQCPQDWGWGETATEQVKMMNNLIEH